MNSPKPLLVIVANEQTPYRIHFHRRIVREIPWLELRSVFTHQNASSPWAWQDLEEIHPLQFGAGESSRDQARPGRAWHEWKKGGAIIRHFTGQRIAAMVIYGYNDPCRLRLIYWCRRNHIPCFLFGDSNILADTTSVWKRRLKKILLPPIIRACSGIFVCGELGRQYFERYGADPARIYRVPYEPDYESLLNPDPHRIADLRNRFHLDPNSRHLLFVGRLEPVKDPGLLLDAFLSIANQRPDWNLILAGEGSLRVSLESSVPEAYRSRVVFTGFFDDPAALAALYALADVFVLPSRYEPWGVVLSEAACHMALIASDCVGAAHELIDNGENGQFFRTGDLNDFKDKLLELTGQANLAQMKQHSREFLKSWLEDANPVKGLMNAMEACTNKPK